MATRSVHWCPGPRSSDHVNSTRSGSRYYLMIFDTSSHTKCRHLNEPIKILLQIFNIKAIRAWPVHTRLMLWKEKYFEMKIYKKVQYSFTHFYFVIHFSKNKEKTFSFITKKSIFLSKYKMSTLSFTLLNNRFLLLEF